MNPFSDFLKCWSCELWVFYREERNFFHEVIFQSMYTNCSIWSFWKAFIECVLDDGGR